MEGRTRRQNADHKLIMALACGATVESAARQAEISERTVSRRLKDPEFQAKLQAERQEMVGRTTNMLTAAAMESVKTLLRLQGDGVPHSVQLGAARAVVELGARLREHNELFERVAALEARLDSTA
jgi:hypothetical protein